MNWYKQRTGAAARINTLPDSPWRVPPFVFQSVNGWCVIACRRATTKKLEWVVYGSNNSSVLAGNPAALERTTGLLAEQSEKILETI